MKVEAIRNMADTSSVRHQSALHEVRAVLYPGTPDPSGAQGSLMKEYMELPCSRTTLFRSWSNVSLHQYKTRNPIN